MSRGHRDGPGVAAPRHPVCTLAQLFAASFRRHADELAIESPGQLRLTYAELERQVDAVAHALAEMGFGRGARLAVALPDGPQFAVAVLGACFAATCAPLNDALDEDTLVQLLRSMRIDALIVARGADSPAVRAARRTAVALLESGPSSLGGADNLRPVDRSTPHRTAAGPPRTDDIALLMHTSGTTSAPKIVPWEQWRVAETVRNRVELARLDHTDRCLLALPLHSSAGIRRLFAGLLAGGSVICPGLLDAEQTIDLLESTSATQYFAPPASHIALLEAFERRTIRPRHALRAIWSGTTDLPETVRSRIERAFGVPVIVGYGMTESGSISQTPFPPQCAPAGSVGRSTDMDIAIADEAGRVLGPDETGEILVRGAEVFAGYEGNEEANRKAFRDGWFRTGDAGRIDREGFVYLAGRLTDIVNRGGRKIAPAEVEEALMRHAQVVEAAAFAVPHPTRGQDLGAAVTTRGQAGERELRRFLRQRLAAFKVPSRIIVVSSLPRGSSGKLDRAALAELMQQSIGEQSEPPQGRTEIEIARIFCDVLQIDAVGRHDNFFDLGGDSLRAMRVLTAMADALGDSPSLEALFDHPTVAELAAAVLEPGARIEAATDSRPMNSVERSDR